MKVSTIFNQFFKCNQCKLTLTSPRIRNNQRHSVSRKIMTEKIDWSRLDPFQIGLLQEQCILVDENDKIVGFDSKKHCHLMENIEKGLLHRANEFLLTQRSKQKITFPNYFTNTCCSHPLYNAMEIEEKDAIGVRRAAQRRLNLELGIDPLEIPLSEIKFMTKFLYKAESSDSFWGEHEIDYALIIHKDIHIDPDPKEIQSWLYIDRQTIVPYLEEQKRKGNPTTPWFQIILNNFLFKWWDNLEDLDAFIEPNKIHRL
ncbi:isopentenyl-diphosphate Delta-isomerase 1-like protein [Sarcoptes scabiei]|uniref:isopentenyl-diphosphate Delta-isomerase n=1 Tax=Sarcoptes scabiei TaxID=52283 RepID=A0A131ZVX3_SARSC|nr:isopentenyl-diphosphate Delta-isomerase 1-like protein [Sarcoptes scabiei]